MIINKKIITVCSLAALVTGSIAAVDISKGKYKNLKILPQDISEQKLDSIMEFYSKALGSSCSFCHAAIKNFPDSLDYASDENVMKQNAREMMQMTILINKTYFYFDKNEKPEYLKTVNCKTCHRGEPYPEH